MRVLGVIAATAAAVAGTIAATAAPAQAEPVASVCVTVTEKSVSIGINGIPIVAPSVGAPTTCIVI